MLTAAPGKIIVTNEEQGDKMAGVIVLVGSKENVTIVTSVGPELPGLGLETNVKVGDQVVINDVSLKHAPRYKDHLIFDFRDVVAIVNK